MDGRYSLLHMRLRRSARGFVLRRGPEEEATSSDRRTENKGHTMSVTIFHNPACGASRNTLALIRQSGEKPEVIEYLKTPPSRERLLEIVAIMGVPVRAVVRTSEPIYAELGLDSPARTDDQLIDAMLAHPILINRPIVVSAKGARLCRPFEEVIGLLPSSDFGEFTAENGAKINSDDSAG